MRPRYEYDVESADVASLSDGKLAVYLRVTKQDADITVLLHPDVARTLASQIFARTPKTP